MDVACTNVRGKELKRSLPKGEVLDEEREACIQKTVRDVYNERGGTSEVTKQTPRPEQQEESLLHSRFRRNANEDQTLLRQICAHNSDEKYQLSQRGNKSPPKKLHTFTSG